MKKITALALAGFIFWFLFQRETSVEYGAGVFAPEAPSQTSTSSEPFSLKGYTITPLKDFTLRAKVLAKKDYTRGQESTLSPTDLALGWGRMSDESVINHLEITQSNRWYYWRSHEALPIPKKEIAVSSANMHIIPENSLVAEELKRIRVGNIVSITGHLIRADTDNGWHWVSSLSRKDRGNGACEIILVDSLEIEIL